MKIAISIYLGALLLANSAVADDGDQDKFKGARLLCVNPSMAAELGTIDVAIPPGGTFAVLRFINTEEKKPVIFVGKLDGLDFTGQTPEGSTLKVSRLTGLVEIVKSGSQNKWIGRCTQAKPVF